MSDKEDAKKAYQELVEDLGEDRFRRIYERTSKELRVRYGVSPSWEDTVLAIADRLREHRGLRRQVGGRLLGFPVSLEHDGKRWRVYYYSIEYFEIDLSMFGKFLEAIEEMDEEVSAVIPNMGLLRAGLVRGVKGFAVITRKPRK